MPLTSVARFGKLASSGRRLCNARQYHELTYAKPGNPVEVLEYTSSYHYKEPAKQSEDVTIVSMLAAPWNPADEMTVAGTYPLSGATKGFLRDGVVAGSEGMGQVIQVPSSVSTIDGPYLKEGDFVVPGRPGLGTLRSHCVLPSRHDIPSDFIKLDRGAELFSRFGPFEPAPLFQTGGTAWRMLKDFYNIQAGDTVIQNAGNSAVGLMASQMAAFLGAKPVSIVRRGKRSSDQNNSLEEQLLTLGKNELVLFEEDLEGSKTAIQDALAQHGLDAPRLALNSVGGSSASRMMAVLDEGGTIVTYGGMSNKAFRASAYQMIFRDIRIVGYWQSRWAQQSTLEQRRDLMNQLVDLVLNGDVALPPVQVVRLEDYHQGLERDESSATLRRKLVFDCRE